jgi:hypothetical protein
MDLLGTNFRLYNKRLSIEFVLLFVLALLLVACGGEEESSQAEATVEPAPVDTPATETTEEETEPESEMAAHSGTLRVAMQCQSRIRLPGGRRSQK